MEPTLTHNDIAVFTLPGNLKVGDIIAYNYHLENEEIITIAHRIIAITDEGYQTKGDSNSIKDNYIVRSEDITGIMSFRIPYIFAIAHFADTFTGYLLFILMPATILIIKELKKIKSQEIHT